MERNFVFVHMSSLQEFLCDTSPNVNLKPKYKPNTSQMSNVKFQISNLVGEYSTEKLYNPLDSVKVVFDLYSEHI